MGMTKFTSDQRVSMRNRLNRGATKERQSKLGTFAFSTIEYKKNPLFYTYYMYITFIMEQR